MTKHKALTEFVSKQWRESDDLIKSLSDNADHPTHAKLINMHKGMKIALEDVATFVATLQENKMRFEFYNKYHEYIVGGLMGILIAVLFFLGV